VLSHWPAAWLPAIALAGCFLGLGLGCALAGRRRSAVAACLPLLAMQALLLMLCRPLPSAGQAIVLSGAGFVVNALLFISLGHLNTRLMLRLPRRKAYALCLLGGLLGVAVSALLSLLWTPPNAVWALAWLGTVPLLTGRARRPALAALALVLVALALMLPPGDPDNSAGLGGIGLGALSLGLYALVLLCTWRARPADQTTPQPAANRAA
jgi:hypothetical protein